MQCFCFFVMQADESNKRCLNCGKKYRSVKSSSDGGVCDGCYSTFKSKTLDAPSMTTVAFQNQRAQRWSNVFSVESLVSPKRNSQQQLVEELSKKLSPSSYYHALATNASSLFPAVLPYGVHLGQWHSSIGADHFHVANA